MTTLTRKNVQIGYWCRLCESSIRIDMSLCKCNLGAMTRRAIEGHKNKYWSVAYTTLEVTNGAPKPLIEKTVPEYVDQPGKPFYSSRVIEANKEVDGLRSLTESLQDQLAWWERIYPMVERFIPIGVHGRTSKATKAYEAIKKLVAAHSELENRVVTREITLMKERASNKITEKIQESHPVSDVFPSQVYVCVNKTGLIARKDEPTYKRWAYRIFTLKGKVE